MSTINNNLMAANVANNLNAHYGRLATSVQRLSSGLRVNSSADDAAGLAIRELMRADVAALNQGARNANDAISMLQVADGALAIIDEKLIRMKELAEQAATGTYNSAQRLIIDSEYKAMADEIDRIARATDFNGIKLLDGSLSGAHNGKGLQSTGMMKIHFGTANDSAEDYYYVQIGDCTTKGLGLGGGAFRTEPVYAFVKTEALVEEQQIFRPKTEYEEYTDPDTGKKYYTDGNYFFSDCYNPGSTRLDWETDRHIIERLRMEQARVTTKQWWQIYIDPDTSQEYYYQAGRGYVLDPHNPVDTRLDSSDLAQKAILDRLQNTNKSAQIETVWDVYEDPAGVKYYTCDSGKTYVPDPEKPLDKLLDTATPADKAIIDKFMPSLAIRIVNEPSCEYYYTVYEDPVTGKTYRSRDGGKTFVDIVDKKEILSLDPDKDREIIARLKLHPANINHFIYFDTYRLPGTNVEYYTRDNGKTWITDLKKMDDIALDASDPSHAAIIAQLEPVLTGSVSRITYDVWEDRTNGNKRYYTMDGGATFFDDLNNPAASIIDKNDPGYAALIANFQKTQATATVQTQYYEYKDPDTNISYFTTDKGQTFVRKVNDPIGTLLTDQNILKRLKPNIIRRANQTGYAVYIYPDTGEEYYTRWDDRGSQFIKDPANPQDIALDKNNPAHQDMINKLVPKSHSSRGVVQMSHPEKYLIYEDTRTSQNYYSYDDGKTIINSLYSPYDSGHQLNPDNPSHKAILDNLRPLTTKVMKTVWNRVQTGTREVEGGSTISTQESAQKALAAIDRAIISKDSVRAHLGAMQNRLENTVTNLNIQLESLQASESRISDTDIAKEMTNFVRNQVLTQSAVAMLGQANSYPHMLMGLIN